MASEHSTRNWRGIGARVAPGSGSGSGGILEKLWFDRFSEQILRRCISNGRSCSVPQIGGSTERIKVEEPQVGVKGFSRLVVKLQDQFHVPEVMPDAGVDDLT